MLPFHLYLTAILPICIEVQSNRWVINNEIKHSTNTNSTSDYVDEDLDASDLSKRRFFPLILPGTKWCGAGNTANDYEDLGVIQDTDACCRNHDNCNKVIPPGESKYGLTNDDVISRSSCTCDETFRKCLDDIGSFTSTLVGYTYFNVIGARCFQKTHRNRSCNKAGGYLNEKCLTAHGKKSKKVYQWFVAPKYRPLRFLIGDVDYDYR